MKAIHLTTISFLLLFSQYNNSLFSQGFGEIRGKIKNTDLEVVPYATIKIVQGTFLVGGTQSDDQGAYAYKPLTPGSYEVIVMDPGHATQQINKVKVIPNEATYLDVSLSPNTFTGVVVTAPAHDYAPGGVDRNMYSMMSIDGKDLAKVAGYAPGDIQNVVTSLVSDAVQDEDGVHFRGSKGDASSNYVDGVKLIGPATVPGLSIENLTIFSGGVPAMYGDVTGGLVVVTTKSYFSGIRDKNIRNADYRERAEAKRREQLKEQEALNRQKEIEAEKANNK